MARALMIQGTGSDVGKSLLVAGLARALTKRGQRVRPFKPQNMSNNAAVTQDGGEIGRAQALQAQACGVAPNVDMNPVLLKPQSEIGAQLVVRGKVVGNFRAREYQSKKRELLDTILGSFHRLAADADFVLVEGAGSSAEINLRDGDIANMGFAEAARVPVVLAADIERGGVIASLIGTWELLSEAERALTKGFIVNKFRGDATLFADGARAVEVRTGLKSFGVLPYLVEAGQLPQEDTMALARSRPSGNGAIRVVVPRLPHISNFDDLDPLMAEPDVSVEFVPPGHALPGNADLVVLAGSKSTRSDLAALKAEGWDVDIAAHVRRGGYVLGICGGYQMLGREVADEAGIEGAAGRSEGLGLLDVTTRLTSTKTLTAFAGGYEMHMGATEGPDCVQPLFRGGAVSADGKVMGCYVHGLFADDAFRGEFLRRLKTDFASDLAYGPRVEAALDAIAAAIEAHLDVAGLMAIAMPITRG